MEIPLPLEVAGTLCLLSLTFRNVVLAMVVLQDIFYGKDEE